MKSNILLKWKHFRPEIILLNVRWYLKYSLSFRDLCGMMSERGLSISHTTIMRGVHKYAPQLDQKIRPHLKAVNDSWRVDEYRTPGPGPPHENFLQKKEVIIASENN